MSATSLLVRATLLAVALVAPARADGWGLFHELVQCGELELRLPEGELRRHCARAAERLRARTGLEVVLLDPSDAGDRTRPRILLGTLDDPDVQPVAEALGVEPREDRGFRFGGRSYQRAEDGLVAWFEDPERPGLPVALYLAVEPQGLPSLASDLTPPVRPSAAAWHAGDLVYRARLSADGDLLPLSERESWSTWKRYLDGAGESRGHRLHAFLPEGVDVERYDAYAADLLAARSRLASWLELPDEELGLRLFVHGHHEDLRALTHATALAVPNPERPGAHVLLDEGVPDDGGAAALEALARRVLGPPAEPWLGRALGVAAAESWWSRPLDAHVARLAAAGATPTVAELGDPAGAEAWSEHVRVPLQALLVRLEAEHGGAESLRALWSGARAWSADPALEERFRERLDELAASVPERERRGLPPGFVGGVALEPEADTGAGPAGRARGYGTRDAEAVLAELAEAGARAVVLSTYAFVDPGWPEFPAASPRFRRRATQSDTALASVVAKARARGLAVVLQPHLLTSPSGVHAGGYAWSGPDRVEAMLTAHERFLEHYALLAELLGVELLVVGTELDSALDFRPDPRRKRFDPTALDRKRARWVAVLARVRALFAGELTYAARSSHLARALERFELWSELDYAAASLYQPVQQPGWKRPTDEDRLSDQLQAMARAAERVGRPLLVLTVGFPSSARAAFDPSRPGNPREGVSVERQARLYEALGRVLEEARSNAAMRGAFLWKVSVDPAARGPHDAGYTPLGKPAEEWLPQVFGGE